jgi:hypothetical protein
MKKAFLLFLVPVLIGSLTACNKELSEENGNPITDSTGTEVGTWQFMSLSADINQTTEYTEAGNSVRVVTAGSYTSIDNAGTITFTGTNMVSNNVTFGINTSISTYMYVNGIAADSVEYPLATTMGPYSQTAPYQKIGEDSLYFQTGGLVDIGTGGLFTDIPSGYKIAIQDNTMTMTLQIDEISTENNNGIPQTVHNKGTIVATLQKQE